MDTTEAVKLFEALMIGGKGSIALGSPEGLMEKLLEAVTNGSVSKTLIPKPLNTGIEGRRWRRFADAFTLNEEEYQGLLDWLEEEYPATTEKFCEAPIAVMKFGGVVAPPVAAAPSAGAVNFDMTSISGHLLNDVEKCSAAQGIPTGELAALSFLLFTGSLPAGGDCLRPGEDPRMSQAYTRMRKTGMTMLQQYLERENVQLIQMWFRSCQTYAAENGKPQMASAIAMFWSDTEAGFGDDVKLLVLYIEKYLSKYPGRGLPCSRDHKLFMDLKLIDSSNELEGKKTKSSKKNEAAEEMAEMRRELAEQKSRCKRLEERQPTTLHGGYNEQNPSGEPRGERTCDYCGKKGHFKATCRERIKAEKKKKKKEEEEAVEEDE